MTENLCVRCGRPTPDGYADVNCAVTKPRAWLAEIADMVPAARDVAQRQARHGTGGGASGKPGSSLPIDLAPTSRLDGVQTALTTWARHIGEIRGVEMPRPPAVRAMIGPTCARPYSCDHGSCKALRKPLEPLDDIAFAALWLADHCEWMRHRPEVDEWLTDVEACARVVRGIARGPAAQRYLGPCGAERKCEGLDEGDWPEGDCGNHQVHEAHDREPCEGDVYGPQGGQRGTCRTCGAQVDQGDRQEWLNEIVRQYAYTASEIAHAYPIRRNTINQWASRNRLVAHDHNEQGRARYNLGDVLELAAEDAARREERRVQRETKALTAVDYVDAG